MSKAGPLVASVAAARIVGPSHYGALAIVQSTVVMLQTIAGAALGFTASKYVAECRHADPQRAARVVALSNRVSWSAGLFAAVALVLGSRVFASALGHPDLALSLALGAPVLVGGAIAAVQTGILAGLGRFRDVAVLTTISSILGSILAVGGVLVAEVPGFMVGSGVGAIGTILLQRRAVFEALCAANIAPSADWRMESGILLHYALPAALCFFANVPSYWLTNAILVHRSGLEEMGIFNAAFQWRTVVLFIPSALNGPMVAMLASAKGRDNHQEYRNLLAANGASTLLITSMGAGFMVLAAPTLLGAYGSSFVTKAAEVAAVLLVASAIPGALAMIAAQAFASAGRMWVTLILNVVWGVVLVAAFYFSEGGARALAMAHVVSASVQLIFGITALWFGSQALLRASQANASPVPLCEESEVPRSDPRVFEP